MSNFFFNPSTCCLQFLLNTYSREFKCITIFAENEINVVHNPLNKNIELENIKYTCIVFSISFNTIAIFVLRNPNILKYNNNPATDRITGFVSGVKIPIMKIETNIIKQNGKY